MAELDPDKMLDLLAKQGDVESKRAQQIVDLQQQQLGGIVSLQASMVSQKLVQSPDFFK